MNALQRAASLRMVRCRRCGSIDTPTRAICTACLSPDLEPAEVPGSGSLASWTTIRRAPTRFRDDAPYDVAVVDLDSGQRVSGRLATGETPPGIGARVVAVSADGPSPVFAMERT